MYTPTESLKSISESLESSLEELNNELDDLKRTKLDKIEPDVKKSESFIVKIGHLHSQIDHIKQDLIEQVKSSFELNKTNACQKHIVKFKENLIKNVSQIEEYKNLIDHIDVLNQTIGIVQFLHEFETDLTSKTPL